MASLNQDILTRIPLDLPSVDEQIVVADILSALDDRVALIQEVNVTLESVAQAIFKSWFIDFDPVRSKAEGYEPEGMDAQTAALFPTEFQDSELGPIPKGWMAGSLADLASLNPESWSAKWHPDTILYVDLSNAKDNRIEQVLEYSFADAPSRARRVLRDGDTIAGTVRPGNRSYAFIQNAPEGLTGSTGFAVLRPTSNIFTEFVYLTATSTDNIKRLSNLADGGAYPAVSPELVQKTAAVVPPPQMLEPFSKLVAPLFARQSANRMTEITLSELRDTLLPRLISGQLRIPDAQAAVEEALTI